MTDGDLVKTIRSVVSDEIESALKPVIKTLDKYTAILDKHTKKLDVLWEQTVELAEDMTEIKITLKSNTVDLDQTKKRLTAVEDHLSL